MKKSQVAFSYPVLWYKKKQIRYAIPRLVLLTLFTIHVINPQHSLAGNFYVTVSGSDESGNGSDVKPWRTLQFACAQVDPDKNHTITLSEGTYIEGPINVPSGVSILGSGKDKTIIKAAPHFYYNPARPGYGIDKFLISLTSLSMRGGNQTIKNLRIDGDSKKLHGGIFVKNRNKITIESVKVQHVNFSGIWLWGVTDCTIKDIELKDCAWGSTDWCSAALQIANSSNIDISNFNIDEGIGYGIKNLGHDEKLPVTNIKIHDGRVSVVPTGLWNNGSAPNITIELWGNSYPGTEIYNCYVDNHISLVGKSSIQSTTPLKIYNNVFDILESRAMGKGYCLELSISDVEIYNNWFNGGTTSIVNWSSRSPQNWNIHHNVFYSVSNKYPSAFINIYKGGLSHASIYNNTFEMTGKSTINLIELNNAAQGDDIKIKNNLIINSNTTYAHYPNRFISLEKGAAISRLIVTNNLFFRLPLGNVPGAYLNNLTLEPGITKEGARPKPYYVPKAGSPLINKGTEVGLPFAGAAPDIGAFEFIR